MSETASDNQLVSIVLPTYKRAHVLPHAIRSVLAQTYPNWELIVVDDNSPDNTPEIVRSFSDERIRYVRNDPNLKLPRALNKGFSLARGAYLTWTSDDNLYADNAIEKMVSRLQAGDCDFVYADYYVFSEQNAEGRPLDIRRDKLPDQLQLEKGNHIGACFMYTRKVYEAIGDYDPELLLVEDYDYFIRAARLFGFCHIPEALYYFRRDDDTLYLSRFAEVKASDVLVRYSNGLLSETGLMDSMVGLIMRKTHGLKNPWLRWSNNVVHSRSYRLTELHRRLATSYLRHRIASEVTELLNSYKTRQIQFRETRDALAVIMKQHGTIEYK
jgi:glycosyltransferase involved in cell wall biosynthesis